MEPESFLLPAAPPVAVECPSIPSHWPGMFVQMFASSIKDTDRLTGSAFGRCCGKGKNDTACLFGYLASVSQINVSPCNWNFYG